MQIILLIRLFRIHDPPNRVSITFLIAILSSISKTPKGHEDVIFHSLFTDEQRKDGGIVAWRAIQMANTSLEFFNE